MSHLERYSIRFEDSATNEDVTLVERLIDREGGYVLYCHRDLCGVDVLVNRRAAIYLRVAPCIREFMRC